MGAFLAVLGAAATLTSVAAGSARQALTPGDLLGRVVTAFRLFGAAAGFGALTGGFIAREMGLRAPLWSTARTARRNPSCRSECGGATSGSGIGLEKLIGVVPCCYRLDFDSLSVPSFNCCGTCCPLVLSSMRSTAVSRSRTGK